MGWQEYSCSSSVVLVQAGRMGKYDIELGTDPWIFSLGKTYDQIDETGQKNSVLTLYELSEGDLAMTEGTRVPFCVE